MKSVQWSGKNEIFNTNILQYVYAHMHKKKEKTMQAKIWMWEVIYNISCAGWLPNYGVT